MAWSEGSSPTRSTTKAARRASLYPSLQRSAWHHSPGDSDPKLRTRRSTAKGARRPASKPPFNEAPGTAPRTPHPLPFNEAPGTAPPRGRGVSGELAFGSNRGCRDTGRRISIAQAPLRSRDVAWSEGSSPTRSTTKAARRASLYPSLQRSAWHHSPGHSPGRSPPLRKGRQGRRARTHHQSLSSKRLALFGHHSPSLPARLPGHRSLPLPAPRQWVDDQGPLRYDYYQIRAICHKSDKL